jgi:hypothetical protein
LLGAWIEFFGRKLDHLAKLFLNNESR